MTTTLEPNLDEPIGATVGDLLADFQSDTGSPAPVAAQQALVIARLLQRRASALQTAAEKKQQHELERMMQMPHDKATLMQMTDQSLRSTAPRRVVDQLTHILDVQGIPRFFAPFDRAMLKWPWETSSDRTSSTASRSVRLPIELIYWLERWVPGR